MRIEDSFDESIKGILGRYAYHMTLYYGKPGLEEEYNNILRIIERDIKNIRETHTTEYKLNIENKAEATVVARSFTAKTNEDGGIELVIELDTSDFPPNE